MLRVEKIHKIYQGVMNGNKSLIISIWLISD